MVSYPTIKELVKDIIHAIISYWTRYNIMTQSKLYKTLITSVTTIAHSKLALKEAIDLPTNAFLRSMIKLHKKTPQINIDGVQISTNL